MNLNSFMPVRLVTGAGCVKASAKELGKLGKSCLIVSGKHAAKASGAAIATTPLAPDIMPPRKKISAKIR